MKDLLRARLFRYGKTLAIRISNIFTKEQDIGESKQKWNELARKDARYYVFSDPTVSSNEEEYKKTGEQDVRTYFLDDCAFGPELAS